MGILLMTYRKLNLLQQQNDYEYQLEQLNQKLMDYQSMSSTLANDSVSMTDVASMPASLFGVGIDSMMLAHNQATQYAGSAYQAAASQGIFGQAGMNTPQMQQIAYMKFYEQGRQEAKKRQEAALNEKEKQIQIKKTKLEALLESTKEELQSMNGIMQNDIKSSVSHYGLA